MKAPTPHGVAQEVDALDVDNPSYDWRLITPPTVTGRMRVFGADPLEPDHLYVATDTGTLLRSEDGGTTWDETIFDTYALSRPEIAENEPHGDEDWDFDYGFLAATTTVGIWQGLPSQLWPETQGLVPPVSLIPVPFFPVFYISTPRPPLEASLLTSPPRRPRPLRPRRLAVCPDAAYPLLIANRTVLFGSSDDGITFQRLMSVPERDSIGQIACLPGQPNELVVGTTMGVWRSSDGGVSFDLMRVDFDGLPISALDYRASDPPELFVASGTVTYRVQLENGSIGKVEESSHSGGFDLRSINWLTTGDGDDLWVATNSGIRMSPDAGHTWTSVSPALLETVNWKQVLVGPSESDGSRVAVLSSPRTGDASSLRGKGNQAAARLNEDRVLASDDGGKTFYTFFEGTGFRHLATIKNPPDGVARWWLLGDGELWTTSPPSEAPESLPFVRQWAKRRLGTMENLRSLINRVLVLQELHPELIEQKLNKLYYRNFYPRFDLNVDLTLGGNRLGTARTLFEPRDVALGGTTAGFTFGIRLTWWLPDLFSPQPSVASMRSTLYPMRQGLSDMIENAWQERKSLLRTLVEGSSDEEALIIRTRIEVLDAILADLSGAVPDPNADVSAGRARPVRH